ncbi:MAG: IPT/TIG domain-containing protein [Candidatus Dormiibacterota bacterium]
MRIGNRVVLSGRRLLAGISLGVAGVLIPLLSGGAGMAAVRASVIPAPAGSSTSSPSSSSGSSSASGPAVVTQAPHIPVGATAIGAAALSAPQTGAVALQPRDPAALAKFIAAVTNKRSTLFHHYLPAGAFRTTFGPSSATISAVESDLAASDLRITGVSKDGMLIDFSGTTGSVEHAFSTGLTTYRLADGRLGQATTSAIRLPASIAGSVSAVVGLDNLVSAKPLGLVQQPATNAGTQPQVKTATFSHPAGAPNACSAAQGAATAFGGLTDDQIANAYGAFGLYAGHDFGAGQTIAVYELEPFQASDISTFDNCYFGSTAATQMAGRLSVVPVDGGQPAGPGSGEAVLDVQDVSGIAPGANINVYEAPNTSFGGLDEYSAIVNNDTAQVVTSSWGLCEQAVQLGEPGVQQAENFLFQQAAAQGQSIFAAAGDTGTDDCNAFRYPFPVSGQNPLSVDDPSSQPYVVSVGGTTIYDAATQPASEKVWNDGANWGAGGGGISMSWTMPSWQQAALVPGMVRPGSADYNAANALEASFGYPTGFCAGTAAGAYDPCRTVPDVSAQANEFTGAVTIYSSMFISPSTPNGWITIGGTSSATPIWAASLALVNASNTSASCTAPGKGVGFVSPLLYGVASNPTAYAASFNDITSGNNDIFGLTNGQVFPATTGYDLASGLGSPQLTGPGDTPGLAYYLCNIQPPSGSAPTVSGLTPAFISTVGNVNVTINGTGFMSGSTPDVASVQIGGIATPKPTYFTVNSATQLVAVFPPANLVTAANSPQDGSGPADVIVTLTDGLSSAPGPSSTIEYVDENTSSAVLPSVTGVSPYGGLNSGGKTVTIFGSGFSTGDGVTFGGVAGTSVTVVSPFEITAVTPAAPTGTACVNSPAINPTNDVCQVQVVVTNGAGSSATDQILPPYEGAISFNVMGVVTPAPGTETMPAPTEYDYVPPPSISDVSTSDQPPLSYASELGGSLITITGSGFNPLTLSWVSIGNPALASSQDFNIVYETGTTIELLAPAIASSPATATIQPTTLPVTVTTLAGSSPLVGGQPSVTYAGIPLVTGVVNNTNSTTVGGMYGAPDTGGTSITIAGSGFAQALPPIQFSDYDTPFSIGTQYNATVNSDTSITTQTVAQNSAIVDVQVCTVTGCSLNPPADFLVLYPPGNPVVDSISPNAGSPAGGTPVTINGENLGCITGVFFGTTAAATFSNLQAILDCGQTYQAQVTSPPGAAGSTVPVTVTTLESMFTGSGPSATNASFTYEASAYSALTPTRLLDTRTSHQTLGPNSSLNLTVAGPSVAGGAVPAGATAVALNVTATNTTAPSYLSLYPAGSAQPTVSNLNWTGGQTVANLVIVPVGANGQVTLYNSQGSADVVVDLEGFFFTEASGSTIGAYVPLTPARVTDTRAGSGEPNSGKTLSAGSTLNVTVTGVGGVPAAGVMAVVLNVTATDTTAASFFTAYPEGGTRPLASNLNWAAGETVANRVVVPVNPVTGQISVYNASGQADLVVDVDGYFTAANTTLATATLYTPITPVRVVDTRQNGTALGAGSVFIANMAGIDGIGSNATAVVTNLTAVNTTAASYFTAYPGGTRPLASDVNWKAGQVVPNLTIAALSGTGSFDIYNANGEADLLIDAFGYFSPIG